MKTIIIKNHLMVLVLFFSFVFVSCNQKTSTPSKKEYEAIEKYLDNNVMETSYNGKIFSSHLIFMKQSDKIYLWAYMQEYYKREGKTHLGSGWSVPLILNIENSAKGIIIIGHKAPCDGELYSKEIKELFPEKIQQQIFEFPGTQEMKKLEEISRKRSEKM